MSGRRVDALRRALIWAAPFLIALAGYLVALRQMQPPFTADEPHYALEAFSIARDGDVDLANDYADIDRVRAATDGQTTTLQPHAYRFTPDGPLSSMHHAGLPLLLAPAARISQTVKALQLEMVLLAAIAAQLLFTILAKIIPGRRGLRWAAWAAVVFSLPLVGYSSRLYPELPAALLVLGVVRILLSDRLRVWQVFLAGVLIAYLPWLHVRFGLVAAGLIVAVILRLIEQRAAIGTRAVAIGSVLVVGVLVASLGIMSVKFERWYGTHSLTAQLHTTDAIATSSVATTTTTAAPTSEKKGSIAVSASDAVPGTLRGLISARNGWLPFVPVGLLAVAGAVALAVRARWWMALGVLIALGYSLQIAATGILPAYSLPGRYEMVYLPLIAVPLALVIVQLPWTRWAFWPLAAIGGVITLFGMTHAGGLVHFQSGTAKADIGAANVLLAPWPSVSREPPSSISPTYTLGTAGAAGDGDWNSGQRRLPAGEYAVAVNLKRSGGDGADPATAADVRVMSGDEVIDDTPIAIAAIPVSEPRTFIRAVRLAQDGPLGVQVRGTGRVAVQAGPVSIRSSIDQLGGLGQLPNRWPDLGAVLVWLAVLAGLAVAIALTLPPRASRSIL